VKPQRAMASKVVAGIDAGLAFFIFLLTTIMLGGGCIDNKDSVKNLAVVKVKKDILNVELTAHYSFRYGILTCGGNSVACELLKETIDAGEVKEAYKQEDRNTLIALWAVAFIASFFKLISSCCLFKSTSMPSKMVSAGFSFLTFVFAIATWTYLIGEVVGDEDDAKIHYDVGGFGLMQVVTWLSLSNIFIPFGVQADVPMNSRKEGGGARLEGVHMP